MHHRKPGPIPAAAERDDVTAEIIADGVHIHPAMVRLAFNMFGDDRMILISDTLRAAGLEDGTYDLGGQDVTVKGPVATIENGALAGMFGDDRMILISDTLRAAGLEDGTYDLGGQDVTVKGPVATIENGALAGSVSDLMRCFYVAVHEMNIPLASAVKAATANPARALGLEREHGTLAAGAIANAVLLDKETLEVKGVVLRGKLL